MIVHIKIGDNAELNSSDDELTGKKRKILFLTLCLCSTDDLYGE